MGKHPKLDYFVGKFAKGEEFCVSRFDYYKITGIDTPQNSYYTKKNSAIAKRAKEYGYEIEVVPEQLRFVKR